MSTQAFVDKAVCRKRQGKAEQGNSCLQTPGTCESCPEWTANRGIEVVIRKKLDGLWATPEDFASMSDEEVVELCREDIYEFCDNAEWEVKR